MYDNNIYFRTIVCDPSNKIHIHPVDPRYLWYDNIYTGSRTESELNTYLSLFKQVRVQGHRRILLSRKVSGKGGGRQRPNPESGKYKLSIGIIVSKSVRMSLGTGNKLCKV